MAARNINDMIITMAELLDSKEIETARISKALELLCQEFSFEAGLVYDIDRYSCFNLQEKYCVQELPAVNSFATKAWEADYRKNLACAKLSLISSSSALTAFEKYMLEFFAADSLVIGSIIDENKRLSGLVVLLNAELEQLSDERKRVLDIVVSMLSRYISVRINIKRISFARLSLERILDNTGIDIYVNDFYTHDVLYVNKSMAAPYGGTAAFDGKCWQVLFPGSKGQCEFCPQLKLIDEEGNPTKVYSWDYERPFDGSWFRVFSAAFRWVDGRLAHVVSSVDITENKRNEELIKYMANYDELTKLPNRRMFLTECKKRIDNAVDNESGYVLFFDIDGFKAVNDSLGHDAGDELLIQLGSFFNEIPMLKNSIYRNGGDEFVAIFGGVGVRRESIRSLGHFIHERFKKPWVLEKGTVFCNTSIGVACYPEDGHTADSLVAKADQAMYVAKKQGGGKLYFLSETEKSK